MPRKTKETSWLEANGWTQPLDLMGGWAKGPFHLFKRDGRLWDLYVVYDPQGHTGYHLLRRSTAQSVIKDGAAALRAEHKRNTVYARLTMESLLGGIVPEIIPVPPPVKPLPKNPKEKWLVKNGWIQQEPTIQRPHWIHPRYPHIRLSADLDRKKWRLIAPAYYEPGVAIPEEFLSPWGCATPKEAVTEGFKNLHNLNNVLYRTLSESPVSSIHLLEDQV